MSARWADGSTGGRDCVCSAKKGKQCWPDDCSMNWLSTEREPQESDKEIDAARELFVRTSNRVDRLRERIESVMKKYEAEYGGISAKRHVLWSDVRADLKRAMGDE